MLNIPNTITLLRIVAVPFFLSLLVEGSYRPALDRLPRHRASPMASTARSRALTNTRTELGAHLDPLADKLLLVSSFVTLGVLEFVPVQFMIIGDPARYRDPRRLRHHRRHHRSSDGDATLGYGARRRPSCRFSRVVVVLVRLADVIVIDPVVLAGHFRAHCGRVLRLGCGLRDRRHPLVQSRDGPGHQSGALTLRSDSTLTRVRETRSRETQRDRALRRRGSTGRRRCGRRAKSEAERVP